MEDAELGQQMYQVSVYPRKEQECVLIEHDHIPSASLHPSPLPSLLYILLSPLPCQQPWYRITQGHHPVNKATAAEVQGMGWTGVNMISAKAGKMLEIYNNCINIFPFQIAALMCMCHAEQVDGSPDPETNLDE